MQESFKVILRGFCNVLEIGEIEWWKKGDESERISSDPTVGGRGKVQNHP